jgi:hypothetical protein
MTLASAISLLGVGVLIAALLAGAELRLVGLSDAAGGVLRRRADLAHVVAILNHVLAAEAVVVSIHCHKELLGTLCSL